MIVIVRIIRTSCIGARLASTDVVIGMRTGIDGPEIPPALEHLGRQADHRMIGEIGQPHRRTPGERVRAGHAHHAGFRCQRLVAHAVGDRQVDERRVDVTVL